MFLSQILKIAKMDFFRNSITLLSLFKNKNDVTLLINQNLNLHVVILFFNRKMILGLKIKYFFEFFLIFAIIFFFCVSTIATSKTLHYSEHWFDRYLCLKLNLH